MCGIAGIALTRSLSSARDATDRMLSYMNSRGPDANGLWAAPEVVLGHRRLSILDLDARANQPMMSSDSRYAIVFNGEIYNFRELRRELEADGKIFYTSSDTEVLLALFVRDGERMLPRLRGMFAFAIWDKLTQVLFLARDPYGIKPLYYTRIKDGLLFASQVKALLASGLVSTDREPAGLVGFYLWGSVPEPWSLYREVSALPAGHWLLVRSGLPESPVCWHDISHSWQESMWKPSSRRAMLSKREVIMLEERVQQAVVDTVRAHLVADVPVSVFLSGGIDSAVLAGVASEMGALVEGITIGFDEFTGLPEDEVPDASAIAAHYGLQHSVRHISRSEFEQEIPLILDAMDQPTIDGVNTWFACKLAAERGYKVVLSGVGGDELFAGYSSFLQIPRKAKMGRALAAIPGARELLAPLCSYLAKRLHKPKMAAIPAFMDSLEGIYFLQRSLYLPEELPTLMGADWARQGLERLGGSPPGMSLNSSRNGGSAIGQLESMYYLRNQLLRDGDWTSMGHSIELRTPFVDIRLLETLGHHASNFLNGAGKRMLSRTPTKPLPEFIVNRPKTGFGLPMAQWLSTSPEFSEKVSKISSITLGDHWSRIWSRIVAERFLG